MARGRDSKTEMKSMYITVAVAVLAAVVSVLSLTMQSPTPPVSEAVSNYTPGASAPLPIINVAVIGDSIAHGSGASDINLGWVGRLGRSQAWNVTSFARGGTGYVSTVERLEAAQESCRRDRCPNFRQMIEEVKAVDPALIIVSGGRNDMTVPASHETRAITEFFQALRATFPQTRIVATNVLLDSSTPPPVVGEMSTAIKNAVVAVGGQYFNIGQPLEGRDYMISQDGIHPNDQGHDLIFSLVLAHAQSIGLTR